MLSRKEINHRYYENHKNELKQKRKEKANEKSLMLLKQKLENFDFEEKNIYLEKMNGWEMDKYCENRKKKFNLQYDIDNFDERKNGNKKERYKKKKEAYEKWCVEMDVLHRIEKYRLFRNSYLKKFGKEPNLTAMVINENLLPEEINPNSEKYNENLLVHLEEKEGDKKVKIILASDAFECD